jgi:hypothetical protein
MQLDAAINYVDSMVIFILRYYNRSSCFFDEKKFRNFLTAEYNFLASVQIF